MRMIFDRIYMAFQTHTTRISTFLLAHDGSNRTFPEIEVHSAHHELSHHRCNPQTLENIGKIDRFSVEQLDYFLKKMRDTPDGEGSLRTTR